MGFGGGGAGLKIGRMAAVTSYLKLSGVEDFDQEFEFQKVRATVAYEAITSSLSPCPVLTFGPRAAGRETPAPSPTVPTPSSGAAWHWGIGSANRIPALP